MRITLACLICSASAAFAGWQLNDVVPSVQTTSALLAANHLESNGSFTDTNSHVHVVLVYDRLSSTWTAPQLFDVDITTGTAVLETLDGVSGRPNSRTMAFTNGWLYGGTGDGDGGKGSIWRYHPSSGTSELLLTSDQKAVSSTIISDDGGWVVFGEFYRGTVKRYRLADGLIESLGQADTNYSGTGQYVYTIGADSRYIYCGLGQSPWYLGVVDTQSTNRWTYWKDENRTASGGVYRGGNGAWYYSDANTFYQLIDGHPVATNRVGVSSPWLTNENVVVDSSLFTAFSGQDFDYGGAYPDSSNNVASLRWAASGTEEWNFASVTNFILDAAWLKRVIKNDSGLFVVPFSYLSVMRIDSGGVIEPLGRTGYSLYDALLSGGKWYLSGYPAATFQYDPATAWNLTPTTLDKYDASVNPRKLTGAVGKYHQYSAVGADGYLYIGGHHERDSVGGELGWFDTETLAKVDSYRPTTWTYSTNDVRDLKAAVSGTKMIYLASGWPALYVFDTTAKNMERTNSVIIPTGVSTLDKCVEVSSGVMVGVSSNIAWRYIIASNTATTNTLPGLSWSGFTQGYDHRLELGPDGFVWLTLGSDLYRIHATTLEPELVKSSVGAHNVVFNGGDAYLYNPTTPELHVLSGLLVNMETPRHSHTIGSATLGAGRIQ